METMENNPKQIWPPKLHPDVFQHVSKYLSMKDYVKLERLNSVWNKTMRNQWKRADHVNLANVLQYGGKNGYFRCVGYGPKERSASASDLWLNTQPYLADAQNLHQFLEHIEAYVKEIQIERVFCKLATQLIPELARCNFEKLTTIEFLSVTLNQISNLHLIADRIEELKLKVVDTEEDQKISTNSFTAGREFTKSSAQRLNKILRQFPKLKRLQLRISSGSLVESTLDVSYLVSLEELTVCWVYRVDGLHKLKHLKLLSLLKYLLPTAPAQDMLSMVKDIFSTESPLLFTLTDLTLLDLTRYCKELAEKEIVFQAVTKLSTRHCGHIAKRELSVLARLFPNLTHLDLAEACRLTDDALACIPQLFTKLQKGCS